MTCIHLDGVSIRGLHACVPSASRDLADEALEFTAQEAERLQRSIGVQRRRVAPAGLMTSDLCQQAATALLKDLQWDPDSIDVLIFVTQTADYVIPSTACALQHRLGLGPCMAFDVNLGCSGYVYGLWTAAALLQSFKNSGRAGRALVLAGDISTARLLKGDKSTVPLFGDAGSATALELDAAASPMAGMFGTDGSGAEHILVEAGGLKCPLLPPAEGFSTDENKTLHRKSRLHLNGLEVFNFTLKNVPPLIDSLLRATETPASEIDHVVMHQANEMMIHHLSKKSQLETKQVPVAMREYGNTSSASIPLTIAAALSDEVDRPRKMLLVGFGVGWSWGAIQLQLGPMPKPRVLEWEDHA